MGYIETLRTRPDMVSPGVSACQGCGGELVLRHDELTGATPGNVLLR